MSDWCTSANGIVILPQSIVMESLTSPSSSFDTVMEFGYPAQKHQADTMECVGLELGTGSFEVHSLYTYLPITNHGEMKCFMETCVFDVEEHWQ